MMINRQAKWVYHGQSRPPFAHEPAPGQESVWDYPRPPHVVPDSRLVEVKRAGAVIASSTSTVRVLETASPPTFYIPPGAVDWTRLLRAKGSSICEWKGIATYWALLCSPELGAVGWSYDSPTSAFERIRSYVSFYPAKVECYVSGERVLPQPGGFYGGWITSEVVGPFKGDPGAAGW